MTYPRPIPADWRLHVDEVSNNVYRVKLVHRQGPAVETTGPDLEALVQWCIEAAADIDGQPASRANAPKP